MKKETINEVAAKLNENYRTEELFMPKKWRMLPDRSTVIAIIRDLRQIIFRDILVGTVRWNQILPIM